MFQTHQSGEMIADFQNLSRDQLFSPYATFSLLQMSILHSFLAQTRALRSAYLLIRLWYQAGDAAVFVQEVLKLQVADNEPLRLSQGLLSCVLAVN